MSVLVGGHSSAAGRQKVAGVDGHGGARQGRRPGPPHVRGRAGDGTYFRCGGCGAIAVFAQREPRYGWLVHGFLECHEACGNAVETARVRRG
jgi:hypothetical protein